MVIRLNLAFPWEVRWLVLGTVVRALTFSHVISLMEGNQARIYYSLAESRYSYISATHMSQITFPCFRLITWEASLPSFVAQACKNTDKIALCYRRFLSLFPFNRPFNSCFISSSSFVRFRNVRKRDELDVVFLLCLKVTKNLLDSTFCVVHLRETDPFTLCIRVSHLFSQANSSFN